VSEKRLNRGIFGRKTDERTYLWRKLRNKKLPNLYSSPDIIMFHALQGR
jgi:hypothetical protein